jgi:pimeloyl-ACP methyl ester carboxylesterase
LHVLAAGPSDGPPVILLHGFPEFWYGWRHQIGPLAAAGLRLIVPDQRGYNLSGKPDGPAAYALDPLADDIIGLADTLGHQRFAIVGHDWGAVVAWHLAGRNPERITRAAILNGPHLPTFRRYLREHPSQARRSWYVGFFRLALLPELMMQFGNFALLCRTLRRTSRAGTFGAEDWPIYRAAWRQPGALTAMLNWYRAISLPAGSSVPQRIRVPVRIIWGERDAFLDRGLADSCLAICDRGEIFRFPDVTHWVQHEEPDAVNRLLIQFMT